MCEIEHVNGFEQKERFSSCLMYSVEACVQMTLKSSNGFDGFCINLSMPDHTVSTTKNKTNQILRMSEIHVNMSKILQ